MRRRAAIGLLVLAACGTAAIWFRPDLALRVATGTLAHDLCSKTFVSGLEPVFVVEHSIAPRPGLRLLAPGFRPAVDRESFEVRASWLGLATMLARFRPGLGCTLIQRGTVPAAVAVPAAAGPSALPALAGPEPVEANDPPLKAAIDAAFTETPGAAQARTRAVVVLHEGRLIAERYGPGYRPDTEILGFSMTKSVTSALVGILVRQGRLRPDMPAPLAPWRQPGDPRGAITIEHLMRMTSGLDLDETGTGFDPSNRMFYTAADMAGFAMAARPVAAPGTRFAYSSASTHLLARIVTDIAGGPDAVQGFARRELFDPLGMGPVTLEVDGTGTPVGAHYMLATARGWARFGQLYLDDGMVAGRRILTEGWVTFSATPTLDTGYGAGFWTVRGDSPMARSFVRRGVPADAFMAFGNLGQRIVVLPTQRLVIVKLGDGDDELADLPALMRLVRETIAAVAR